MMSRNEDSNEYRTQIVNDEQNLQRFVGFDVADCDGKQLGTVESIWLDAGGEAAFISVQAGWLGLGRAHVVPAQRVRVNEVARKVKLPYSEEIIKAAPPFEIDNDSLDEHHDEVLEYYAQYEASLQSIRSAAVSNVEGHQAHAAEEVVALKEERMQVGKREVASGGYRLRKVVHKEVVNQPVELKREELVIERVPMTGAGPVTEAIAEDEIFIPLRREEAVVGKDVRVREELRARKNTAVDTEIVSEQLAHEDVEVEKIEAIDTMSVSQGAAATAP